LCKDKDQTSLIAAALHNSDEAWLACPDAFTAGNESWGKNKRNVKKLAQRLGIKVSKNLVFAAGSMFWARNEVIKQLKNLEIAEHEYSLKHDQLDGAIPHAVERLFGVLIIHHERKTWMY
jgi:lipopolysaccharide biosynthesis protein